MSVNQYPSSYGRRADSPGNIASQMGVCPLHRKSNRLVIVNTANPLVCLW